MTLNVRNTIYFEQGWEFIQKGITKLKNMLEGPVKPRFNSEEVMMLYTTVYNMCYQRPHRDYSRVLYYKYRESFEEYITSTVSPSIMEKHDEFMLRELVKRWANHKVMVKWLSRVFQILDRYMIRWTDLPSLKMVGFTCFRDLVYQELYENVKDAVASLIIRDRDGKQIDHDLLKNVYDIFAEIRVRQMDHRGIDFEAVLLNYLDDYYFLMVSNRILEDPRPDYMFKAEGCLEGEKDRVSHYLHSSSEPKLLENVQHELLSVHANQKDNSGCHTLLRDEKDRPCVLLELMDAELSTKSDTNLVNTVGIENGEHVATTMMDELPLADNETMEQSKKKKKKKAKTKKTVTEAQPRALPQYATHDSPFVQLPHIPNIAPPIATEGHRSCLEDLVRIVISELANVRNEVITLRDEVTGQGTDNTQMREDIDGLKKVVIDLIASSDKQDQAAEAYIPPRKKQKVPYNVKERFLEDIHHVVDPPICPLPNPRDPFPSGIERRFSSWMAAGVGYVDIGVYDAPPSFFKDLMTYATCLEAEHINGYMLLLRKRATAYPAHYPQNRCNVDTWFLQILESAWRIHNHDLDKIDWCASKAINFVNGQQPIHGRVWSDLDELYMPVNIKNEHWIAGRVDFKGRLVELIDSCECYASDETILELTRYIRVLIPRLLRHSAFFPDNYDITPFDMRRVTKGVPQQEIGGNSCGVFCSRFIEFMSCGLPLSTIQVLPEVTLRRRMAIELWRSGTQKM